MERENTTTTNVHSYIVDFSNIKYCAISVHFYFSKIFEKMVYIGFKRFFMKRKMSTGVALISLQAYIINALNEYKTSYIRNLLRLE